MTLLCSIFTFFNISPNYTVVRKKIKWFDKILMLLFYSFMQREENKENEIISEILELKKGIESKKLSSSNSAYLAFWDFDGTILKGDCSEGLRENGEEIFKGLVELGILKGYAKEFKGKEGVAAFWKKYREMEAIDKKAAYIFLPQIFAGNREEVILDLAKEHFQNMLKNYYFSSSIRILEKLEALGIKSYIISASAHFFVKGMSGTLPIGSDCLYGIEVEIENGIVTPKEISPVTYADGKREKLIQIVENILEEKKADKVFVLAGFGNSFHTDGPFLKYIAEQKMETGKAVTVMINGGDAPTEYKDIFKEVNFSETIV